MDENKREKKSHPFKSVQDVPFSVYSKLIYPTILQVDKFKPYPDLMAELFKAMARSPPTKRRK